MATKKVTIKIKPENRGEFTRYCGGNVTDKCIQRGLDEGGARAKQANFARNARKWNKRSAFE